MEKKAVIGIIIAVAVAIAVGSALSYQFLSSTEVSLEESNSDQTEPIIEESAVAEGKRFEIKLSESMGIKSP